MDKDEQIKRLAQNLFNSGFTKSMDHAIQTAANMLGFPDSMLVSKSTKESREEMGANTVTTGVSGMYNRDLAKRITQSIAEERVFSQVPSSIRSAFETSSPKEAQPQSSNAISPQDTRDFSDDDLFVKNSYDDVAVQQTSNNNEDMFSSNFPEQNQENNRELANEIENHDLYSSQPHIFDQEGSSDDGYSSENFIENNNEMPETEMPEWNEEEQTSLISGFVDSNESPKNDNSENSFESFSGGETSGNYDNIFKGGDSKNLDMTDNSEDYQIESRFETVLGGEEDFFTTSSRSVPETSPASMNEEHRQESFETRTTAQPEQRAPAQQADNVAEATVDLTQMFDFRNLKN